MQLALNKNVNFTFKRKLDTFIYKSDLILKTYNHTMNQRKNLIQIHLFANGKKIE